jgi:hypothetical protein
MASSNRAFPEKPRMFSPGPRKFQSQRRYNSSRMFDEEKIKVTAAIWNAKGDFKKTYGYNNYSDSEKYQRMSNFKRVINAELVNLKGIQKSLSTVTNGLATNGNLNYKLLNDNHVTRLIGMIQKNPEEWKDLIDIEREIKRIYISLERNFVIFDIMCSGKDNYQGLQESYINDLTEKPIWNESTYKTDYETLKVVNAKFSNISKMPLDLSMMRPRDGELKGLDFYKSMVMAKFQRGNSSNEEREYTESPPEQVTSDTQPRTGKNKSKRRKNKNGGESSTTNMYAETTTDTSQKSQLSTSELLMQRQSLQMST